MDTLELDGFHITESSVCYIIAEAGVGHLGDLGRAKALVDAAFEAGADAVKFQTFNADAVVDSQAAAAPYQRKSGWVNQRESLKKLELDEDAWHELYRYCKLSNLTFLSTPFDQQSVDLLDRMGAPAFKVSSGDLTNRPLLRYIASKDKPIILSTGMGWLSDVDQAVRDIQEKTLAPLVLLHCVSHYPARPVECNLQAMNTLQTAFQLPVGFSDHTVSLNVPLAAVAMGARVLEKHLKLGDSDDAGNPDGCCSLSPEQFGVMVDNIREIEAAAGDGVKAPADSELALMKYAQRSMVAARDIKSGEVIRPDDGLMVQMLRIGAK